MAAETHVQDAGAARKVKAVHVHDGTAVRAAKEIWVQDAVAARKVFQAFTVVNPLPGGTAESVTVEPTSAIAGWRFSPDGTVDRRIRVSYFYAHNWGNPTTPGAGDSLYIRAVLNSGTGLGGDSFNTWLPFNIAREWRCSRNSPPGAATMDIDVQIATDAAGTNIIAQTTTMKYTAAATVESGA